jgi:response regulator NasT
MFLSAFADEPTRAKVEALGAKAYLVKPLDIGQIVPTVDRVMAALRGSMAGAAPAPPVQVAPVAAPVMAPDLLALGIGILMHRHTLSRARAAAKLHALAQEQGLSPAQQAQRLVDAIEILAESDG